MAGRRSLAVRTRVPGVGPTGGRSASWWPPPTGVVMSAWIWAAVRALLYTRTSSISPVKYSPHTLSPPNRRGAVDAMTDPDTDLVAAWVPLTYSRMVVPSYVVARCVQAFRGKTVPAVAW